MEILALIPARGGSKGIPGKNLREIAGKPLIAWSIEHARRARHISRVVVTTEDESIASVARQWGAEAPFRRPAELAMDTSSTEPALIHAIDWLSDHEGYRPDAVALLQPTSPVRADDAIDRAIGQWQRENADSLVSVGEFWSFLWRRGDAAEALYDYHHRPRRQDIPARDALLRENGSIYLTRTDLLRTSNNRLGGRISMFVMGEHESFEIDTPLDWLIVEAILKQIRDSGSL